MMSKIKCSPLYLFSILLLFLNACSTDKVDSTPDTNRLLSDGFGIQGVSIKVKNLDQARNYFSDTLGFSLPPSEWYEKGLFDSTEMASYYFADFSTFDLIATTDSIAKMGKQASIMQQNKSAGLYAFSTSSVDSTSNWLQAQGFKTDTIRAGRSAKEIGKGWDWDNGGPQWQSLSFANTMIGNALPSFLQYMDLPYQEIQNEWKPVAWRRYYQKNPNGVVTIEAIRIVVEDLEASSEAFEKMGLTVLQSNDRFTRFKIASNQELYVTTPKSPDDALGKILKTKGPGVYSICFGITSVKETHEFLKKNLAARAMKLDSTQKKLIVLKDYAFGMQLEFVEESKEQALQAKIYDYNDTSKMNSSAVEYASNLYSKYCALCHGKDRQGYAADNAPSLKSHSLMATTRLPRASFNFLVHTVAYGRDGTAMAPYGKKQGGPLDREDVELLLNWLYDTSGVEKPVELDLEPVIGNAELGKTIYDKNCTTCHGKNGEGITAPALANPMFLATASDAFIHYTITNGREGTPMMAYKDSLSKKEINAVTAYLRSRASGWNAPAPVTVTEPLPKDYVLNPNGKAPKFTLIDGKYVPATQLLKALKDSTKMVILDARSTAGWQQSHIPGAVSVPYYKDPDKFIKDIPNDNTMIVVYCACPHAASEGVVNTLTRFGYKNTAILDEGILVWAQKGYPVQYGKVESKKK